MCTIRLNISDHGFQPEVYQSSHRFANVSFVKTSDSMHSTRAVGIVSESELYGLVGTEGETNEAVPIRTVNVNRYDELDFTVPPNIR